MNSVLSVRYFLYDFIRNHEESRTEGLTLYGQGQTTVDRGRGPCPTPPGLE